MEILKPVLSAEVSHHHGLSGLCICVVLRTISSIFPGSVEVLVALEGGECPDSAPRNLHLWRHLLGYVWVPAVLCTAIMHH